MAGKSSSIKVSILGDDSSLRKAFGSSEKAASGFNSKLSGSMKGVAGALAGGFAVGKAIDFGKGLYDAAIESQKVSKQTEAVIKSMGGAANVTADQVGDLAASISMKTGIDDEMIQTGQNMLLTFGNIRNEVGKGNDMFDQATKAAVDMSTAMGTDTKTAAVQLGKALNDPTKGVTALAKSGVSFTQQQKDQIKAMQESGDMLGAQKIIMGEVEKQFGGSAEAQATAGGKLKTVFGNLQEELGAKLLPAIEGVSAFLAENLPGAMETVGAKASELWNALEPVRAALAVAIPAAFSTVLAAGKAFGEFMASHKELLIGVGIAIATVLVGAFVSWAASALAAGAATLLAMAPVILIGVAIAALVAGIIWAYKNWDFFRNAVDAVARFMKEKLWPALQSVASWITGTLVPTIGKIITKIGEWIAKAAEVARTVVTKFGEIVSFVTEMPGKIASAASGMWDGITSAFKSAINSLIGMWNNLRFPEKSFNIPKVHVPGTDIDLGGGKFTVGGWDLPNIPYLAKGGNILSGGSAIVGERGPELLDLPTGARVTPLSGGAGGTTIQINLHGSATKQDGQAVVDALIRYQRANGALPIRVVNG